jgi:hypothetical protein
MVSGRGSAPVDGRWGAAMAELSRRQVALAARGSALTAAAAMVVRGGRETREEPSRGKGEWTTFGSVALLSAVRLAHTVAPHGHAAGSDLVRLDVEVHNGLRRPLLFSPGQFRVRMDGRGPTVTPYDAERAAGALAGGTTTRTWVSYLVPRGVRGLRVEFTEAASTVLSIPVTEDGAVSGVTPGRRPVTSGRHGTGAHS